MTQKRILEGSFYRVSGARSLGMARTQFGLGSRWRGSASDEGQVERPGVLVAHSAEKAGSASPRPRPPLRMGRLRRDVHSDGGLSGRLAVGGGRGDRVLTIDRAGLGLQIDGE